MPVRLRWRDIPGGEMADAPDLDARLSCAAFLQFASRAVVALRLHVMSRDDQAGEIRSLS